MTRKIEHAPIVEANKDVKESVNKEDLKSKESGSNPAPVEIVVEDDNEKSAKNTDKEIFNNPISQAVNNEICSERKDEKESTKIEETTDPLNIGQVSLMTDDNSDIDQSDMSSQLLSVNPEKSEVKVDTHKEVISMETGKSCDL